MKKITAKVEEEIINRIIQSDEFKNSAVYCKLLKYLYNHSRDKEPLKEITIAIDFFGKSKEYHPLFDSTVRTYVFHLRKKMEYYYQTQGQQEIYRARIPKGGYQLEFIDNNPVYHQNDISELPLWGSFFKENRPIIIAMGDIFIYHEYQDDIHDTVTVRNLNINSLDELKKFSEENINKKIDINPIGYSFFNMSCVQGLGIILPFFARKNISFQIKEVSRLSIEDLEKNHVLFFGNTRCLGFFRRIVNNPALEISVQNDRICFHASEKEEYYFPYERNTYYKDHGILLKLPGLKGNEIIICSAFHVSGIIGLLSWITHMDNLEALECKLNQEDPESLYYKALFEISGYNIEAYKTSLIQLKVFSKDIDIWE